MTWKVCSVVKRNAATTYLAAINKKSKKYQKKGGRKVSRDELRIKLTRITAAPSIRYKLHGQMEYCFGPQITRAILLKTNHQSKGWR